MMKLDLENITEEEFYTLSEIQKCKNEIKFNESEIDNLRKEISILEHENKIKLHIINELERKL